MEQFCRALHPDLDLSSTCLSWFRQATEHCTSLILRKRGSQFWASFKNFIFPERQTGLLNQNIPISIHPQRLSIHDCHSLFLDIVNDYILRAPRYAAESSTNVVLWQILYSLMGIMALGSLLVATIFAYQRYGRMLPKLTPLQLCYTPEKRARAYVNRNMRIMKYELQRLRVQHVVQPDEVFAPDGTVTLVLRVASKLNVIDSIVTSQEQAKGRLYRLHDLMGKKHGANQKPDFKVDTVARAMRFLNNNYSRKLRVMFIFDEDPLYEHQQRQRRRSNRSPPSKHSSPPKHLPALATASSATLSKFLAPALTSQSSMSMSCSSSPSLLRNSSSMMTRVRTSSQSPRSQSPTKQRTASPRVLPTQIPRTFGRRNSSFNLIDKQRR